MGNWRRLSTWSRLDLGDLDLQRLMTALSLSLHLVCGVAYITTSSVTAPSLTVYGRRTGWPLTEKAEVTDIVNFSPLCPTIQCGTSKSEGATTCDLQRRTLERKRTKINSTNISAVLRKGWSCEDSVRPLWFIMAPIMAPTTGWRSTNRKGWGNRHCQFIATLSHNSKRFIAF